LNKSIDELVADDVIWVIPAMKHIKEIFCLYPEGSSNKNQTAVYRPHVINKIQGERLLIVKVCDSLNTYMEKIRAYIKGKLLLNEFLFKCAYVGESLLSCNSL